MNALFLYESATRPENQRTACPLDSWRGGRSPLDPPGNKEVLDFFYHDSGTFYYILDYPKEKPRRNGALMKEKL